MKPFLLILPLLFLVCCTSRQAELEFEAQFDRMDALLAMIEGSWEAVEPGPITELHIARLPEFSKAFYVEETGAGGTRQWVYMMSKEGPYYIADTWRITRPEEYVGAWNNDQKLAEMSMYYLRPMNDCRVVLLWEEDRFTGKTAGGGCAGSLIPEAEYASTSISFDADEMEYGFEAFDDYGKTIRGSEEPQVLRKK